MRSGSDSSSLAYLIAGAVGGFIATVPMTVFMIAVHQFLPDWQQYALPPERLTDWVLRQAGYHDRLSKRQRLMVALLAHFGFGSSAGALYGMAARTRSRNPAAGVTYGLGVYAADYCGWIPALDIMEPPTDSPKPRVAMMVLAHVVYGASLAGAVWTLEELRGRVRNITSRQPDRQI
jgi:hypothetical protein